MTSRFCSLRAVTTGRPGAKPPSGIEITFARRPRKESCERLAGLRDAEKSSLSSRADHCAAFSANPLKELRLGAASNDASGSPCLATSGQRYLTGNPGRPPSPPGQRRRWIHLGRSLRTREHTFRSAGRRRTARGRFRQGPSPQNRLAVAVDLAGICRALGIPGHAAS